jgi:hypothetical protein
MKTVLKKTITNNLKVLYAYPMSFSSHFCLEKLMKPAYGCLERVTTRPSGTAA